MARHIAVFHVKFPAFAWFATSDGECGGITIVSILHEPAVVHDLGFAQVRAPPVVIDIGHDVPNRLNVVLEDGFDG